jgi:two-component system chemotaxis response regulator CheB
VILADDLLRILVVDDSALYRQMICNVLREAPDVEVVGTAKSGRDALEQVDALAPDLLTLDVRMPDLDGIDVLRELKKRRSPAKAVMVSGFTAEGAQVTTDALMEGAFDFILKPSGPDAAANRLALLEALREKLQAFRDSRSAARRGPLRSLPAKLSAKPAPARPATGYAVAAIGTSTGGPVALREVLGRLPGDLPAPLLIVQHMPAQYTHSLAMRLNEASPLEVVEACDGMALEPGFAFLAPGGRQMKVVQRGARSRIQITDDPPENSCRPSVDYLLRSVADAFGDRAVAVIMTGMGRDGAEGCRRLKQRGACVIAQHPDGCAVFGMPKAVIDEQLADHIVPLGGIAASIMNQLGVSPHTRQDT